jgi:hypothetical protein
MLLYHGGVDGGVDGEAEVDSEAEAGIMDSNSKVVSHPCAFRLSSDGNDATKFC